MKKYIFVAFLICSAMCHAAVCHAQVSSITYNQPNTLNQLIKDNAAYNRANNTTQGYRIQLYLGDNREAMNALKTEFVAAFPSIVVYPSYEQPNFKLRTGDYRTRFEAYYMLKKVQVRFANARLVNDKIMVRLPAKPASN
jgi:hypothetical protein